MKQYRMVAGITVAMLVLTLILPAKAVVTQAVNATKILSLLL